MLLSPAAGHHTYTVHWHAQASTVTKEDGEFGSGGWFWEVLSPSQSHEPRSKVAAAVAAGKKKRCVCVCVCVNGGEERRIGTVGRGRGGGGKKGGIGKEGWRVKGVRAANTAVERS